MKKPRSATTSFGLGSAGIGLLLSIMAFDAGATVTYWNPQGTNGSNPYTGDLTEVWESNVWSTSSSGQATPQAWVESTAACFGVNTGSGTPPFTVLMNSNHTVAGFFDGPLNPNSCTVTVYGPGIMTLPSGLMAFDVLNATDGSLAYLTISNTIAGSGVITAEGNGQLFLNGANTHTGGIQFGYSGASFSGIINFNSAASFGTGGIILSNTSTGVAALVYENTNALTVTNAWTVRAGGVNIVGTPAGLTFSGNWNLAGTPKIGAGGTGNLVILSGVMSGAGGLNKFNASTLRLSAANTFTGSITVSNGTLQLGANGGIPNGSGKGNISIVTPGILDVNGFSGSVNGLSGTGTIDNTAAGAGTLSFGNNNQNGSFNGYIQNTGGTLNLTKAGTGIFTNNSSCTYSGNTAINGGTYMLGNSQAIPSTSAVSVANGAVLDLNHVGSITVGTLSGPGAVANNDYSLTVDANASTNSTLATYSCFSGAITNGFLIKDGTHTMALRGSNAYSSATTSILHGTLSVGAAPNRLPVDTTLNISSGALFQLDANNQTVAALSGYGNINIGTGKLTINSSSPNFFPGVLQDSELPGVSTAVGHGLRGYYYANQDFSNLQVVRDDTNVNFTDLTSSNQLPAAIYPKTNNLSIRWVGQVQTTVAGNYTFTTTTDDGARLWVNGTLVVDSWVTQSATARSGSINLAANTRYDIVMEYFQQTGGASAKLGWTPPGDTVSTIIAPDYLYLPSPGGLVLTGSSSLQLSASNTYSGGTLVNGGLLEATVSGGLGTGNVTVAGGAILQLDDGDTNGCINSEADLVLLGTNPVVYLNFTGTNIIHGISFDGINYQPQGTYGPVGSGANHESALFEGSGFLLVTAGASSNVLTFAGTPVSYGSPVTFTSTVTGVGATPTGTVTFYDGASAIGTASLNGSGVATLTVSDLQAATSPHSITAVYNGDSAHTRSTASAVSQVVTPLVISPGTIAISNKVYDATTAASISNAPQALVGVLANDTNDVHLTGTATFADKTTGTNKLVNVTGLVLTGSLAANYTLSTNITTTTGNVAAKALTVTNLLVNNKPYDGTTTATLNATNASLVGVIAGDNVTLVTSGATATFSSAAVGNNKTITINGITAGGPDGGNYTVTQPSATANITKGISSSQIVSSANPSMLNSNVIFTATVSGPGATPTGNVVFQTNGINLSTLALTNGTAIASTAGLPLGTNTITLQYGGDANYQGVTNSISQYVVLTPPILAITNGGTNVIITWSGNYTLQASTNIPGGWSDLTNATSPYTNPVTGIARFFRLK